MIIITSIKPYQPVLKRESHPDTNFVATLPSLAAPKVAISATYAAASDGKVGIWRFSVFSVADCMCRTSERIAHYCYVVVFGRGLELVNFLLFSRFTQLSLALDRWFHLWGSRVYCHWNDVMMDDMASQIASTSTVWSTAYWIWQKPSKLRIIGPPHKVQAIRKTFPYHDGLKIFVSYDKLASVSLHPPHLRFMLCCVLFWLDIGRFDLNSELTEAEWRIYASVS